MASKLAESFALCERVKALSGGKALVSFSGGKDSLATLDVVVRVFGAENVTAFHRYLVKGLEVIEKPLLAALMRYPGVRFEQVPDPDLARMMKNGVLGPPRNDTKGMKVLREEDVINVVRKRAGAQWVAFGQRRTDSLTRRIAMKRWGLVWESGSKFYPIGDWRDVEVYDYLKQRKIPIPTRMGGTENLAGVSGFGLDPWTLWYLSQHHPADYARVVEAFPWAPAQIVRIAMYPELAGIEQAVVRKPKMATPKYATTKGAK